MHEALEHSLALVEAIRAQPTLTLLLFETMLNAVRDEALRDALATMIRGYRSELASALERDGVTNAAPLAAALAAAWDGLFLHAVVDDQLDIAQAGETILRIVAPATAG